MSNSSRKVAVSYSWKEEAEGPNAGQVGAFCDGLKARGIEVVRDKDEMKHGESISAFMQSLGASDLLCVFLSERYLTSPNCMYELLIAWQRSRDNPAEYRQRVKVWVVPEIRTTLQEMSGRLKFVDFWRARQDELDRLASQYANKGLGPDSLEECRRVREFAHHVEPMLHFFKDQLSPGSPEEFSHWIQSQFPISAEETAGAAVYENVIREIEGEVNRSSVLREFLLTAIPGFIHEKERVWRLSSAMTGRQFVLRSVLDRVLRELPSFRGQPSDWRGLGEVLGGFVVLAVNAEWVVREKTKARKQDAEFPGDSESISVGGGRQANLLHLVTSALADGRARLDRVFGKPPLDDSRLPDAPAVSQGISPNDQLQALKMHFIRCVLGPAEAIDAGNTRRLEIQFARARDAIKAAYEDDHSPYVATGPSYRRLTEAIRVSLAVEDLLMVHPSGEDPAGILPEYVPTLRALGKIYDAIQIHGRS